MNIRVTFNLWIYSYLY